MNVNELARLEVRTLNEYVTPPILDIGVKLNQNESPFDLPLGIKQKICEKLIKTNFNRYPDGSCESLRKLIAKKFSLKTDNVIIGAGIDELFYYLMLTFVNKGDKVIRPVPSFGMYEICSKISGSKDTPILLSETFDLTEEFIRESKDAKLVFICNPNNPTGNLLSKDKIKQLIETTAGIVCIDEAYADFANQNCLDLLKYQNVVVCRTFSKAYSIAGIRLGYLLASKEVISLLNRVRLPWNIGIQTQVIGEILLENEEIFQKQIQEIKQNQTGLQNELSKLTKVFPSDSNFLLFETQNPTLVYEKLIEKGVIIRNISKYPKLEKCLRVNTGTKEENEKFLNAFKEITRQLQAVIFDIDGVLVDVSSSYNEAIKKTVEKFTGKIPTNRDIEKVKQKPYSNNDWVVTYALATNYAGDLSKINTASEEFLKMKQTFQDFYLGGLIDNEPILIDLQYLQQLVSKGINVGVVTSRPRVEALYALNRITRFNLDFVIAQEDCNEEKPSPKPINLLIEKMKVSNAIYIGDTINDRLAAQKANLTYFEVNSAKNVNAILKQILSERL